MEPSYGSMKPEHVQIYTGQILTDLKLAFQGESNYIEQGMEYLRRVVGEQLESKNPMEDHIVALKDEGLRLEREFESKYKDGPVVAGKKPENQQYYTDEFDISEYLMQKK